MPKNASQLRYTDAEVEQIKALFPDLDSLKLYRKYLLNLPLTKVEIQRIKDTWALKENRDIIIKTTLPTITGNEAIGVGYDALNSISIDQTDFAYQMQRVEMFVSAVKYLNSRIKGFDNIAKSATGKGSWLTAAILAGGWKNDKGDRQVRQENTFEVLKQICIKANVEGLLIGLQNLINVQVETDEEKAARIAADSTN